MEISVFRMSKRSSLRDAKIETSTNQHTSSLIFTYKSRGGNDVIFKQLSRLRYCIVIFVLRRKLVKLGIARVMYNRTKYRSNSIYKHAGHKMLTNSFVENPLLVYTQQ